jgi:hypothetical protein
VHKEKQFLIAVPFIQRMAAKETTRTPEEPFGRRRLAAGAAGTRNRNKKLVLIGHRWSLIAHPFSPFILFSLNIIRFQYILSRT